MSVKVNIAENLRAFRKKAGLSADEVGKCVGKSGKTIYAWESGRGEPDGEELILLCKLFGVKFSDFYGNEYKYAFVSLDEKSKDTLSDDESELVDLYRLLPRKGQHAIITGLRDYVGVFEEPRERTNLDRAIEATRQNASMNTRDDCHGTI